MIGYLIGFLLGVLATIFAAWVNHKLSLRRDERDDRRKHAEFWRQYSDDYVKFNAQFAELQAPVVARVIPNDPWTLVATVGKDLNLIRDGLATLEDRRQRAPEPLTDHVRLFLDRIERAQNPASFDWEIGRRATRDFRAALDHYVRTGQSMKLPLVRGEPVLD